MGIEKDIVNGLAPLFREVADAQKRIDALEVGHSRTEQNEAADTLVKMADSFTRDSMSVQELPHIQQMHAVCRAFGKDLSTAMPEVTS